MTINGNVIEGTLVYVCIETPNKKYQSEDREYTAAIVVDEDTADEWNDRFPKQPAKVVKTIDFEKEYKIAPVFADEKKQYVIRLKKDAQYKDGNPIAEPFRPKVLWQKEDGKVVDVTTSVLPANGSKGKISFETSENDYGVFAKLKNVLVTEMIEYVRPSRDAGDDFGVTVENSTTVAKGDFEKADAPVVDKPARKKPVVKKADPLDDDIPF